MKNGFFIRCCLFLVLLGEVFFGKLRFFFFGKLRFLVVEFQCSMWVNGDLGCKLIT